jgi:2-phospho-L-lactate guanylyltransferase
VARLVVPYKPRLLPLAGPAREALPSAMLGDVLEACAAIGDTAVVTADEEARQLAGELGVAVVDDPGGGKGAAVAAALATVPVGPVLVVSADLPCATPRDLLSLLGATPPGGLALVRAGDGTTNALALSAPLLHAPVYGPGSAERFFRRALSLGVTAALAEIPNLADDVDSLDDLERVDDRVGKRTRRVLGALRAEVV